ncbi:hypothetical protein BN1086_04922 [Citrobacter koseri]|uniref:Uncharacterized protein n=1 Tax=Citrobacter koseri TaxID=545 RepID=A0A078LIN4_CITKO|nr:hypothetical protein BN1086_04922 [Citrobacter koseri]
MVARGGTGSETIVTTGYYCRKTSFSVPGKPLVDALENNQGGGKLCFPIY